MPSLSEISGKLNKLRSKDVSRYLEENLKKSLESLGKLFDDWDVVYYASSFLQKPRERETSISHEDINGFMSALHGLSCEKGLILLLHTPGGEIGAVESIVEYLHKKFKYINVVVPYLAMSGGSMISLASDCIIMGKQSQIGPIDPQMAIDNRFYSAREIKVAFSRAKSDIDNDPRNAHLWAPILHSMGPSIITEAESALNYSEQLVTKWLEGRMFRSDEGAKLKAEKVAKYLNAEDGDDGQRDIHIHGQRVDIDALKNLGVKTKALEDNQEMQEEVLTAYHLMTILFERSSALKFILSKSSGWIKARRIVAPQVLPVSNH